MFKMCDFEVEAHVCQNKNALKNVVCLLYDPNSKKNS